MKKKLTLVKEIVKNLHFKDKRKLKRIIWSYEGLTRDKERYSILRVAFRESLKEKPDINEIIKAVNYATRVEHYRDARLKVGTATRSNAYMYLLSYHVYPATGHRDYQGKLYYDRYWKSKLKDDKDTYDRVNKVIKGHGLLCMQDMTGEPVYMCTRPNCKHYFVPVTIDEVEKYSVNELLKRHHAISYAKPKGRMKFNFGSRN